MYEDWADLITNKIQGNLDIETITISNQMITISYSHHQLFSIKKNLPCAIFCKYVSSILWGNYSNMGISDQG